MKLRILFTMLVLLTAGALVATAQAENGAVDLEAEVLAGFYTPAKQAGDCNEGLLPDLFAAPITQMGYTNTCGACSLNGCAGAFRGQYCGFNKYCIPPNTMFCPGTQDWDCRCASNYN